MKLFDRVFEGLVNPSREERIKVVGDWFKNQYETEIADENVLVALLDVHEAKTPRPHLAHPEVHSSFGKCIVQLSQFTDGWHVVFRSPNHESYVVLHPRREVAYTHPDNKKVVSEMRTILQSGRMVTPPPPPVEEMQVTKPTAVYDGDEIHIVIPDAAGDGSPDIAEVPLTASSLGIIGLGSGVSVNIDPKA